MAITQNTETHITSINPATLEVLGRVKISSLEEIDATVAKAQSAFAKWRHVPIKERLNYIAQFKRYVFANREAIATVIARETGKPLSEALVAEIFGVLETCDWIQKNARRLLRDKPVKLNSLFLPGKRAFNVYEPLGVIAVISPFNFPFSIPVSSMLAALVAGNTVVLKASPKTALVAETIVKAFAAVGFPAGVIGIVQGDRAEAERLINSDVNRIMFTGSVAAGRAIAGMAAKKLIPCTLELGGKHAAIVLDDCDLDKIGPPLIWAAFTNAGQACASIERLYVVKSIAGALEEKLASLAGSLSMGDPLSPETSVGPLIDESQLGRVRALLDDAIAGGARVLTGGQERRDHGGYFFAPTVVAGVTQSMRLVQDEIFGPVLPIIEVDDEREAVKLANESNLALAASVWSRDLKRAEMVARQLNAGMVWINDGLYTHISPDAPWGGAKDSGYGRMHSAAELLDLVHIKNIGINQQSTQEWNFPYSAQSLEYVRGGIEVCHGAISERIAGAQRVVRYLLGKLR